jgi:hypothetical protein
MKVRYVALGLPSWLLGLAIVQAGECDCSGPTAQSRRPTAACCAEASRCDALIGCDETARCASDACCNAAPCCTDSGLLDAVDQFAGRIQFGLIHFSRKLRSGLRSDRDWHSSSVCDEYCDSGLLNHRSMNRKGQTSCTDCESCQSGLVQDGNLQPIEESSASPPTAEGKTQQTKLRSVPSRLRVPDSQVDPFQDDSQTNLRPLPTKNNRYQRLMPTSAGKAESTRNQHFDSQANRSLSTADLSTADYWADGGLLPQQPIVQITTASSESAPQAAAIKKPYRVRVGDQESSSESPEQSISVSPLRPKATGLLSGEGPVGAQSSTTAPENNPLR